jgi:NADH-quinone oxidoreductase subunit J
MTLPQAFFVYFAVAITGLSVLVVTRRNPVHGVLWMLVLFVHIALLYLFLNAEFLAAIQIIIYAGAVLVLFLVVIMLLDIRKEEEEIRFSWTWPAGLFGVAGLTIFLLAILNNASVFPEPGPYSIQRIQAEGNIMTVGKVLYFRYLVPFEIASLILLVAIIGAVVLTKKRID